MPGCGGHRDVHGEHDAAHGEAELHRVDAGRLAEAVDDRHEDDEPDVEEDGDREHKRSCGERTGDTLRSEQLREAAGEAGCAAGDLDDLPEHGAERDEDRDRPEHAAHAGDDRLDDADLRRFEVGFGDGHQRQPRRETHEDAHDEQRQERVHLEFDDQQQEEADASGCDREQ